MNKHLKISKQAVHFKEITRGYIPPIQENKPTWNPGKVFSEKGKGITRMLAKQDDMRSRMSRYKNPRKGYIKIKLTGYLIYIPECNERILHNLGII